MIEDPGVTGFAPFLPMPYPGDPHPDYLAILEGYRRELGIDEQGLPTSTRSIVEAVHWWNAGAPELGGEPTPAAQALAALDAYAAAGGDLDGTQEYRRMLEHRDRVARVARTALDLERPTRPRPPRSRYAPKVENDADH